MIISFGRLDFSRLDLLKRLWRLFKDFSQAWTSELVTSQLPYAPPSYSILVRFSQNLSGFVHWAPQLNV